MRLRRSSSYRLLLCNWIRTIVLVVALCGQPTKGFLEIQGLSILNPFQLIHQLGLLTADNFFVDLFNLFWGKRRLMCAMKAVNLAGGSTNPSSFFGAQFRDDSEMILPEAGIYVGPADIEEYVLFATSESPYISAGPGLPFVEPKVVGLNDNGECEYLWTAFNSYTMDESMVERQISFAAPILMKLFLDYEENYMRRVYIHYTKPFLAFFFSNLATRSVANFACHTVWAREDCSLQLGAPPDDCVERMMDLPLASDNLYVDGDSFGCRILHAAFANTNAKHCSHVSLDPFDADPTGKTICSQSSQLPLTDYFTEEEMARFVQLAEKNGVDPNVGYLPL